MIEIIREDEWDRTKEQSDENQRALPKDIRQIGKPDIGDRIYVEDRVYQRLHSYEEPVEKAVYVLLGRFENYYGKQCVFVEALVALEEITYEGELPVWNDKTWAYLYKKLCQAYDNLVIVGWAMDICGQLPNLTVRIEKLHNANFGGTHQVLFLMDGLEREEAFYCNDNGHLRRRDGYYVYYDRTAAVLEEAQETEEPARQQDAQRELFFHGGDCRQKAAEDEPFYRAEENSGASYREGNYRRQVLEREERKSVFPAHSTTVVLALIACVLGYNAYCNYEKMNAMEETLAQMNTAQAIVATELPEDTVSAVYVEDAAGTVQKQQETETAAQETESGQQETQTERVGQSAEDSTDGGQESDTQGAQDTEADKTDDGQADSTDGGQTAGTDNKTTDGQADSTDGGQTAETGGTDDGQTAETMTESEKYLQQGYYIVQKGENLASICRKVYQTTAMMDKVCEANGIDNPDSIYAGQYLTLPN